jgi:hypothetical protein
MSKSAIVLYCKSYRGDVKRTQRLAASIDQYNQEHIPFYVSVPKSDIQLFQDFLGGSSANIIEDESIIEKNPQISQKKINLLHGNLSQQIVKSEFWRLGLSDAYLCLDSDSIFIRPFTNSYFVSDENIPYTVIDEAREILDVALSIGKTSVLDNFYRESLQFQKIFDRRGRSYSFGPNPLIWSNLVWDSLEKEYLMPNKISIYDAILAAPIDNNWYGEALLKYKAIPLLPCQPLFKVYHYAWQMDRDLRAKIGLPELAKLYGGVIYQSAWEREMDWPSEQGNWSSRIARRLRRRLGRI